jgi:hypothetical protein
LEDYDVLADGAVVGRTSSCRRILSETEEFSRIRPEDAGVDHKLSLARNEPDGNDSRAEGRSHSSCIWKWPRFGARVHDHDQHDQRYCAEEQQCQSVQGKGSPARLRCTLATRRSSTAALLHSPQPQK